MSAKRFAIAAAALLVLLVAILLLVSSPPSVSLDPGVTMVGTLTPISVNVVSRHGIRRLEVYLEQNGARIEAGRLTWPPSRVWFWRHTHAPTQYALKVGSKTAPGIQDGPATLVIEATANDLRAATATLRRPVRIATGPPMVSADGEQHYINQGGSEVVRLDPSGYWTEAGVRVGKYTFRSFPLPNGGGRFAIYAYPWDLPPGVVPVVFARNPTGAEAVAGFAYKLFPKPPRRRDFELTNDIMRRLVEQIAPGGSGDILSRFLAINRDMRRDNNATLAALRHKTQPRFLFTKPFRQQPDSKVESVFADVRSYIYQGKKVDEEVHLGFDLSVTQHVPVLAANDGIVVFAERLGIYGNCVVVDHGYGIQSIYGHLSEIAVKPGDAVKQGQPMGRSGSTGLALGDHIHFSMQVDGVEVNPVEWWDGHWLQDHLWSRLSLPAAQAADVSAASAEPPARHRRRRRR
jgi:murein DD-endopeptidase MepM/ murein hydrolase activator NlpD